MLINISVLWLTIVYFSSTAHARFWLKGGIFCNPEQKGHCQGCCATITGKYPYRPILRPRWEFTYTTVYEIQVTKCNQEATLTAVLPNLCCVTQTTTLNPPCCSSTASTPKTGLTGLTSSDKPTSSTPNIPWVTTSATTAMETPSVPTVTVTRISSVPTVTLTPSVPTLLTIVAQVNIQ